MTPERRQIFDDPTLGWGRVAVGGVEVHTVPGSHMTILEAPHVESLARILGECLARVEPPTTVMAVTPASAILTTV